MIREKILEIAKSYLHKKELKGNSGFRDEVFQKKMEAVGWETGQAWCSYFAELVWSESYGNLDSTFIYDLQKLFSANAVKTYENFKKSKLFKTGNKPEPGDLVIWAYFKNNEPKMVDIWTLGHIGIVTGVYQLYFDTLEGNTNSKGGREGIEVAEKERDYDYYTENGLRLIGFVKPKEV